MTHSIEQKIVGYKVVSKSADADNQVALKPDDAFVAVTEVATPHVAVIVPQQVALQSMNETIDRPEMLLGSTYKIKTPTSEHALYITVNDIFLNAGTAHEERRPYEIFINSKNMEHFQWVLVLTRLISAVFRKGGDATFLVEEMKAVFDPAGGYFKKGGVFMPSLVAEIGHTIETHMKQLGMIKTEEKSQAQQEFLDDKRREFEQKHGQSTNTSENSNGFPANATLCLKCHTKAVVRLDNCATCLQCSDSKCS